MKTKYYSLMFAVKVLFAIYSLCSLCERLASARETLKRHLHRAGRLSFNAATDLLDITPRLPCAKRIR